MQSKQRITCIQWGQFHFRQVQPVWLFALVLSGQEQENYQSSKTHRHMFHVCFQSGLDSKLMAAAELSKLLPGNDNETNVH